MKILYKEIDNALTGEVVRLELSAEEYAGVEEQRLAATALKAAEAQTAIDKAAILAKLGLTADEAKLLLS